VSEERYGHVGPQYAREVVAEGSERLDLRREESRFRNLGDLDLLRQPLLGRLPPEGREVGRDRERVEDLDAGALELRDLRRVVVRAVLVGARVDDLVARLLEQRHEGAADRVAVGIVRQHHAHDLVRLHLRPEMRVGVEEVLDAEAEVVGVAER
jgi:hypothetical protein